MSESRYYQVVSQTASAPSVSYLPNIVGTYSSQPFELSKGAGTFMSTAHAITIALDYRIEKRTLQGQSWVVSAILMSLTVTSCDTCSLPAPSTRYSGSANPAILVWRRYECFTGEHALGQADSYGPKLILKAPPQASSTELLRRSSR